ncbi:MAG: GTP 3',8-cyclase MoaA [Thermoanaerobacteraceae bacterium]|nr:GTP 3',8-cyclase MoaA [Thermoanaerobacteraceae bacterium]
MKDKIGREIDYIRISVTDFCNLRCIYCMPKEGIAKREHKDILRYEEIITILKECVKLGINKVRITGGEPLVRKGIVDFISMVKEIKGIEDISITTNGILLADMALALKAAGLNRVNISLDTLNPKRYKMITRGGDVDKVFAALDASLMAGLNPVKINMVVIRGINDDEIEEFAKLTIERPFHVRFIELMPIGEGAKLGSESVVESDEIRAKVERIGELYPAKDVKNNGPAVTYRFKNAKGTIGFINPISHAFCSQCNRIRLTADGKLKPCLYSQKEFDIKIVVKNHPELLGKIIEEAILSKPERHGFYSKDMNKSQRNMYQIGG